MMEVSRSLTECVCTCALKADWIVVLEDGVVSAQGTYEAVLQHKSSFVNFIKVSLTSRSPHS